MTKEDENQLVQIGSFDNSSKAELTRSFLASHGIAAHVFDKLSRGEIRLMVRACEVELALKLLRSEEDDSR